MNLEKMIIESLSWWQKRKLKSLISEKCDILSFQLREIESQLYVLMRVTTDWYDARNNTFLEGEEYFHLRWDGVNKVTKDEKVSKEWEQLVCEWSRLKKEYLKLNNLLLMRVL